MPPINSSRPKYFHSVVLFFLAFDFCRFCVVIRFFHPRHNGQWPLTSKDFLSQILSNMFNFPILILEKEPVYFPFECSVLNKGTTGTIFVTSLVWRGPWLGIEPGTSRNRSQHYTTRLSRRRYSILSELQDLVWVDHVLKSSRPFCSQLLKLCLDFPKLQYFSSVAL